MFVRLSTSEHSSDIYHHGNITNLCCIRQLWLGLGYVAQIMIRISLLTYDQPFLCVCIYTIISYGLCDPSIHGTGTLTGPILMTSGPWKPISVHAYSTRIADLRTVVDVKEDLGLRTDISFGLEGDSNGLTASYSLLDTNGNTLLSDTVSIKDGKGAAFFEGKPGIFELWYPVGYGKQALHSVVLSISDEVSSV